jgi:phosphate transport system protein
MEIRTTFHRKLREIQDDILAMGSMVEKAILRSIDALKNRNIDLAKQVITEDAKVNEKRFEIEENASS